jgi:hypothetical protein
MEDRCGSMNVFPQNVRSLVDEAYVQPRNDKMRTRLYCAVLITLWLSVVAVGMGSIAVYSTRPGSRGATSPGWPQSSVLTPHRVRPTLVMIAHPRCTCTRASLQELELILSRTQGRLHSYILFLHPKGEQKKWFKTDLWKMANRLEGATVRLDENGREAAKFGAKTSGHVFLYSEAGKLMFSGGITAFRGHGGANAGREAIISLANSRSADNPTNPVFGCSIFDPESRS